MACVRAGVEAVMTRIDHASVLPALFEDRHTTNHFTDQPVDTALVREAYEHVRWAPTAMNSQPLRLTVVEPRESRERLAPHMAGFNADKTLAAPLTLIAAYDPRWHEHMPHLAPFREGFREQWENKAELRDGMGRTNALLQIGYLTVALRALGLEVGPMAGFSTDGVDAAFHAESGWRSLVVINVGHAASDHEKAVSPRQGRLEFDQAAQVL